MGLKNNERVYCRKRGGAMQPEKNDHPKTILCVDDEQGMLDALCRVLHRMPYRVFTARDGLQAIDLIKKERPDLIMLDLHMPTMDGYGVMKWLRENQLGETPVVMLTGDKTDEATFRGYQEGIHYYLTKPFNNESIKNIIRFLIEDISEEEREKLEQSL